jgi:protein-tyrosine phosphatase
MFDLHCHILPGLDDGPETMAEAVDLGRALADDGVTLVAATPHFRFDYARFSGEEIAEHCESLQEALAAAGVALSVVPGAEVDINAALSCSGDELRGLALGGRGGDTLLVETPYDHLGRSFEDSIFRAVSMHGLRVLLAHPERNPTLQRDHDRVLALVERGVMVQVTAGAFLRTDKRSRSRRTATALVRRRAAHVVSSDAHRARGSRGPRLRAALDVIATFAPQRVPWMVEGVPAALLAGEALPPEPFDVPQKRGFLARGGAPA